MEAERQRGREAERQYSIFTVCMYSMCMYNKERETERERTRENEGECVDECRTSFISKLNKEEEEK